MRPDDIQPPEDIQAEADAPEGDGLVEVEYGGKVYAVPPELKGALMRQADYTRKTQALAQHRQTLEAAGQAVAAAAAAHQGDLHEHGKAALLGENIAHMSRLDWDALQQQDPVRAQALMHQLFQMKQAHEIAVGRLRHKAAVAAFDQQRQRARQVEHAHAVAARDIDGWSPQLAGKLAQYALDQGISEDELKALADPRLVKVLHHACLHHEGEQKTSAGQRLRRSRPSAPRSRWADPARAPPIQPHVDRRLDEAPARPTPFESP
ncbi:MAG: hypothetical protein WDN45_10465 [Caulobacteraceae bacterium]